MARRIRAHPSTRRIPRFVCIAILQERHRSRRTRLVFRTAIVLIESIVQPLNASRLAIRKQAVLIQQSVPATNRCHIRFERLHETHRPPGQTTRQRGRTRNVRGTRDFRTVTAADATQLHIDGIVRHSQHSGDGALRKVHPLRGRVHLQAVLRWCANGRLRFHRVVVLRTDVKHASHFDSAVGRATRGGRLFEWQIEVAIDGVAVMGVVQRRDNRGSRSAGRWSTIGDANLRGSRVGQIECVGYDESDWLAVIENW